ncbi:DNA polymerase I [Parvularcula sp. IMCC14364]|uniref:DNA polymerase I n=1 Tax=Parvularcula sp. IMCC14364 TaxID=3067902 RepID=UPI00274128DF|nr:DNA polymerase I [Parvularcula sp. IMCC14364]
MSKKLKKGDRLYLVDGSSYIFRAYHALPPLTRKSDGMPVGAVSGFCNMLWKLLADVNDDAVKEMGTPTHFAVILDHSSHSFRNDLYSEYKANRDEPPEDLRPQFSLIRDAVRAFGLPCIEMEGYEADDLIATYAVEADKAGAETVIISSDKDLMQLITDHTTMYDTMKSRKIGRAEVVEKFGVGPEKMIDLQALTGDSVDNIPGVPGIGPKTAAQLLDEYETLETLLEQAGGIKQKKRRENLIEFAEDARMSKELVTLKTDVPNVEPAGGFAVTPMPHDQLVAFLEQMEFTTLTKRVRAAGGSKAPVAAAAPVTNQGVIDTSSYQTVYTLKEVEEWVAKAHARGVVAVDTETTGLDAMSVRLVGLCLATAPGDACYIPLTHGAGDLDLSDPDAAKQLDTQEVLEILKPMLEDTSVLKVGQNFKYDLLIFQRYGVNVSTVDDTMLISYAVECGLNKHGMDELSKKHLGHECISFSSLAGTGKKQKTFDQIPIADAAKYAAEDADITLRLYQRLAPRLVAAGKKTMYETLERPMVQVIAGMEREGVKVDREVLSRLSGQFAQRMAQHEASAHGLAGENFNLGSPKQISEILFDKMGLEGGKKTKTGAWSTSADVLDGLAAQGIEVAQEIHNWRQLSKLKGTYTDTLPGRINNETGRVHTSYSLAATPTGRLSSNDPNLQNIPIRTEDGRKIRTAFIADEGNVLISADYSQIELRLLAHIANLDSLKQAFADGIDIHAMTASEMFGVPIKGMDPMVRRRAKAINFGIIYGISAFGLANQLGISRGEAKDYIDSYFEKFPGIKQYMDTTIASAKEQGFVETVFGRRTHIPNFKIPAQRGYAERQAINAPIQGSAADVIRRAMIRMPQAIQSNGLSARMLLQVHDELIFECPKSEAKKTCALVKEVMEAAAMPAAKIDVPLVVETGVGQNWDEAH